VLAHGPRQQTGFPQQGGIAGRLAGQVPEAWNRLVELSGGLQAAKFVQSPGRLIWTDAQGRANKFQRFGHSAELQGDDATGKPTFAIIREFSVHGLASGDRGLGIASSPCLVDRT